MHSRFDTEARIAVAQATDLARELGHHEVGPDHLLLGLLANMRGTAYAALTDHGLRLDAARDLVATHHVDTAVDRPEPTDRSDEPDGLSADREALRAIGIDLDRVRRAVRDNLGADLTDGWGARRERERGERRRGRRGHPHGRGRRGPRSDRTEGPRFSAGLRDVLRDVRRSTLRDRDDRDDRDDRIDREDRQRRHRAPGMNGSRLALAVIGSDDPAVAAVLATATDLDGLRTRLEAVLAPVA